MRLYLGERPSGAGLREADGEVCAVEFRDPADSEADLVVVADRLAGGRSAFESVATATKLELAGVDVASFGDAHGETEDCLEVVCAGPARGMHQKVVVTQDARTLLGGVSVGDAEPYNALRPLLGRELPGEPGAFLSASGAAAPRAMPSAPQRGR